MAEWTGRRPNCVKRNKFHTRVYEKSVLRQTRLTYAIYKFYIVRLFCCFKLLIKRDKLMRFTYACAQVRCMQVIKEVLKVWTNLSGYYAETLKN